MSDPKKAPAQDPEKLIETLIQRGLDEASGPALPSQATPAPAAAQAATGPAAPLRVPAVQASPAAPGQSSPPTGSSQAQASRDLYTQPEVQAQTPGPGTRLHHYEIIRRIGRGGMGSVYLARDIRLGRRVAIKFLHTNSADLTKRFILEARTTAALSHENIVVIFEVDAWQGAPFMVFEYLQGHTLGKFMPDEKALPPARAVELLVPVVRALAYAHAQGIVHRDLKPDNILVTDSGTTKVLDFGIAKVLQAEGKTAEAAARPRAPLTSLEDEDDAELTMKGAMMGTMAYMAPEQWGIGVDIDHRADIWAVGIMLFKALAGKHPLYPLSGPQFSVTGDLRQATPLLSTVAPDVPKELAAAVDRCLLKTKDQRWPDAGALLRALEPFLPGRFSRELKLDESPYAGLASFQEADADRFFGRAAEIGALVNRVRERPLLAVVGPSGAGKSSFVRAGLVPALKRSGEAWESLVLRPGRSPLAALASLVAPLVKTSSSVADDVAEQQRMVQRLTTEPGFVGMVLRGRARQEKKSLLLFVDQFEELYTLVADPAERKAFTACLSAVADDPTSPIRLVVSIRSDFLDRVPEDPRFMAELSQGLVFLSSPGAEGLREAIVHPAELAGYKFESADVVDEMIRHLATTQGALPLLQFCAQKLWENRDAARKLLTRKAYDELGGVAGALASHADAVLQRLPAPTQPIVRAIMLRLVTPERTRAIVGMDELRELQRDAGEVQQVVDELVQARLLVVQTGGGAATVELVHESLIHTWPTLRRWLEESGEDQAFLEQLRAASKQWQGKGRDEDLLWRGELAEEAGRFARRYRGELGASSRDFLDATIALADRQVKRRRAATVGAVAVLSGLLVAAGVALVVINRARGEAETQKVAAWKAEEQARANLVVAEKKEQERAAAAAAAERAAAEAKQAASDLGKSNAALSRAVEEADAARKAAEEARGRAVSNAAEAAKAKALAEEAARKAEAARRMAEDLRSKEEERRKRAEAQAGGQVLDELK